MLRHGVEDLQATVGHRLFKHKKVLSQPFEPRHDAPNGR
jgi:hypothetical protein